MNPGDGFRMQPGFVSFQPVERGQELARDATGPLAAPASGMLLMPLYQGQGEDGYFIGRRVAYSWLKLSSAMRRLRADRLLHWLPGVRRSEDRRETFVVDKRRARVMALQIFHLLGYKRIGQAADSLFMRRRDAGPD